MRALQWKLPGWTQSPYHDFRCEKKTRVEQRGEYETEMKMRLKDALKATGRG